MNQPFTTHQITSWCTNCLAAPAPWDATWPRSATVGFVVTSLGRYPGFSMVVALHQPLMIIISGKPPLFRATPWRSGQTHSNGQPMWQRIPPIELTVMISSNGSSFTTVDQASPAMLVTHPPLGLLGCTMSGAPSKVEAPPESLT